MDPFYCEFIQFPASIILSVFGLISDFLDYLSLGGLGVWLYNGVSGIFNSIGCH